MFLFEECLSLIVKRLSITSNANDVFSLVSTTKLAKYGEWLQSKKKYLMKSL